MRRIARTARTVVRARREARVPFAHPDEIARRRRIRVRAMVAHAYAAAPFWREALDGLGLRPEDFGDADDLARLPVVTPADLQTRPAVFASSRHRDEEVLAVRSGGTTAEPKTVRHDLDALLENAAHGERERSIVARLVGRSSGYREAVVAPPFSTVLAVQAFVSRRLWLPGPLGIRRAYFSMLDDPEEVAWHVSAFRPHVIHGYGSYVGPLVRRMRERGLPPELRVVTYSSDGLAPADRRFMLESGLTVLSTYQAIEAFKIAFECGEAEGLHLNEDLYPVRIVDDRGLEVPPGEVGAVVVSNLVNRATVLLNYRLGDEAAWLPGRCPCGRSLPRITAPLGRDQDWVELADGRRVHAQGLATLFTDETEIRTYQVVQVAPGRFDLFLVAAPGIDREAAEERIARKFSRRFGELQLRALWVEHLERAASGKIRSVIRR